ncbi:hypothetical protein [Plasmodium yoelii yoelii]|uniref:Uncharacterized protein n=1 Tax=Plasmodium yoelii yoelii TaxID=73239 RepID=Q7RQ27_PLAYO|nr:hypothetical protein [Plasmodium yoelii yoelii]
MCKLQLNSRNVLYKKRIIILIKGKRKKERMNEHNITYHNNSHSLTVITIRHIKG